MVDSNSTSIKFVIIGNDRVGKTSLQRNYMGENFIGRYISTLGADFAVKNVVINNKKIHAVIWDLAGQEKFKTFRPKYYIGAHGALIVFDVTNIQTLENLDFWINDLHEYTRTNIPILLVGNKVDLINDKNIKLITEKIKNYVQQISTRYSKSMDYFFTSALTGENVEVTFNKLIQQIVEKQN